MRKYTESELVEKASPELLREKLLETLIALDDFCREHGLRYYLSGGTLLGAVRHQGFIPWDDDIDVNMPRCDCEKLMELSGGRIGKYLLVPPNFDDAAHAYHWKLYNEEILVTKGEKCYPIFIDIFPIEGLPKTAFGNWLHYTRSRFWKLLSDCLWGKKWLQGSNKPAKLFHAAMRPVASLWGKERLFNHVVKVMKSIPYESSDYVGVMATKVHTTEERVVKREYAPVVEVSFENRSFPGPAGYHTYLSQLYGSSYMELPPEEKRISRHGLVPYRSVYFDGAQPPVKIAVCGLIKSENLGEQFIARSLEYLIREGLREKGVTRPIEFVEVDLLGRKDVLQQTKDKLEDKLRNYCGYSIIGLPLEAVYVLCKKLAMMIPIPAVQNFCYRMRHFIYEHSRNYRKRLLRYFDSKMHDCAFIVVDGAGLLEYSYNEYQELLLTVSRYAEKKRLQVVYNAIGRAGEFDEKDFRATILKQALRSPVVKYISARDSQETVQCCAGEQHQVELLADAAFWMKETYGISPKENRKKVGIGLVRGDSLSGYKVNFFPEDWVKLFSGIARELEKRGYEYEFFTNGLPNDIALGNRVLKELGLPASRMVPRPVLDTELYNTISSYRGIITCRLHSSIAAFTLRIPSVILSWNHKVNKLMEHIGCEERAVNLENFEPKYIVDLFEKALAEGVDDKKLQMMKDKAKKSVDGCVDLISRAVEACQG